MDASERCTINILLFSILLAHYWNCTTTGRTYSNALLGIYLKNWPWWVLQVREA